MPCSVSFDERLHSRQLAPDATTIYSAYQRFVVIVAVKLLLHAGTPIEAKELTASPELTEDFMTLAPFHFYAQMPIFTITLRVSRAKSAFEKCSANWWTLSKVWILRRRFSQFRKYTTSKQDEIPPENLGRKMRRTKCGENWTNEREILTLLAWCRYATTKQIVALFSG